MTRSARQCSSGFLLGIALLLLTFTKVVSVNALRSIAVQSGNPVTTVSAASFTPVLAPDSIAAAFGTRLATATQAATIQPLPTSLAGTTIKVNGVLAQLFFVSPTQVNYVIPTGAASGEASVIVTSSDGTVSTGTAQVSAVAPAVFSANASGAGVPAAVLIRAKADGTQTFESVAQLDPTTSLFVPKPISFGASGERLFLILYLCGIRNAPNTDGNPDNGVAESIRVMFGGNAVTPLFAGAAPGFTGLDQINVELARDLNGRVSAQIEFTSITSNVTEIEMAAPGRTATTLALSSSAATPVYGQAVTFTAQVSAVGSAPTGTVIFRDGAITLGSSNLSAGRATITASTLAAGSHQITAHYGGDNNFGGNWTKLANGQTVNKASSALAVTSSANPSVTGQTVAFTAQVNAVAPGNGAPAGQVTFTDGGMMIGKLPLDGSGRATINVPLATTGRHNIAASYEGDANFTASAGNLNGGQSVNKGQTRIVATSSANPSGRDQAVVLTAAVNAVSPASGMPTGVVQFKDGGMNIGAPVTAINGRAGLNISTLALGEHIITAEYYGDPNFLSSVSSSFAQSINTPPLQVGAIVAAPPVYAGDEIGIQGSGFSSDPAAYEVRVISSEEVAATAVVTKATASELRVRVPFGAGSGNVAVKLGGSESQSPTPLTLGTSVSGFVQEAVREPAGNIVRRPIAGMKMEAVTSAGRVAATTNADGVFVFKFPSSVASLSRVDIYLNIDGVLPFPRDTRSMRGRGLNRDNQYNGDVDQSGKLLANIIELKRTSTPASSSLASGAQINELFHVAAPATPEELHDLITSGQVTFDTGNSTVVCPPGTATCSLALSVLDAGRTPANLPTGYFSSTIAQITPFGATLNPGGKLTFPNSNGIPAGTPVRVFRFDQTPDSQALGRFIDIGAAAITTDGTKIETAPNAVTQTSYYFVSRRWPVATIIGKALDANGRAVRRAIANARGQSVFTDNFGGFVLANVPVITPDGASDQVTIEISFVRADGSVARAERTVTSVRANETIQITEDFVLPRAATNRAPQIFAPSSLVVNEGETRDFNFIVNDPDGNPFNVAVSGAPFASINSGGANLYTLRLSPGTNIANNYTLAITATDTPAGGSASVTQQNITLIVQRPDGNSPTANYLSTATNEDTPVSFTLSAANPSGGGLIYTLVNLPAHGSLRGSPPNITYTPDPNFNGFDSFGFKVSGSSGESNVATVFIAIKPVNDAPVMTLSTAASLNASAGEMVKIDLLAMDPDAGQTLSFLATGLPAGASFVTSATGAQFSWTPTFLQAGTYTLNLQVTDNGTPALSDAKTATIIVDPKWAKTSGPEGGWVYALLANGASTLAGTNGGGVFISANQGLGWTPINAGITNPDIRSLAAAGTTLYAGTFGGGVFRSTNHGTTWAQINSGLDGADEAIINSLGVNGTTVFAGTQAGIFRSTSGGGNWSRVGEPLTARTFVVKGSFIFAGDDGVSRSSDNGASWMPVNNGLTNQGFNLGVASLAATADTLFAGTYSKGVYRSTNDGGTWTPVSNGLTNLSIRSLTIVGTTIYAGTERGDVFRSTDSGNNWAPVNNGVPSTSTVYSLAISGATVLAGTERNGIYRTTNGGASWVSANSGLTSLPVTSLLANGNALFAGGIGVTRSTNDGGSWTPVNNGLTSQGSPRGILALAANGTTIFAGGDGIFRSLDGGNTWTQVGLPTVLGAQALAVSGTTIYAGTFGGVFRSTDNGDSWVAVKNGLPSSIYVTSMAVMGTTVFTGSLDDGVFRSDNSGANWTQVNNGLPPYVLSLAVKGTSLFAGMEGDGVYRTTDKGANWTRVTTGLPNNGALYVQAVFVSGSTVFAGVYGGGSGGVYMTADDGANWLAINTSLTTPFVRSALVSGTTLFAGTDGSVFRLANNVQSWAESNNGVANKFINAIAVKGTSYFAGTAGSGIFRSANQGQSWQTANGGLLANANVQAFAVSGNNLFAGLFGNGVHRSGNDGASWSFSGLANQNINALKVSGASVIFAATDAGVQRSSDQGVSWQAAGLSNQRVVSLVFSGSRLFAGTYGNGIYVSTDNGAWTQVGNSASGLGNSNVTALTVGADGATLFAGTDGGGIYRSTNGGTNWAAVNTDLPGTLNVYSFAVSGTKLYAGSIYGVFLSEDNGTKWKQLNAGLLDIYVTSLAVSGNNLIAGTRVGGVFISQIP